MILAGTGHRPTNLGGYDDEARIKLLRFAAEQLKKRKPEKVISGMALGWDQALAAAAILLRIPVVAAVPFIGQEGIWPPEAQKRYRELLRKASKVEIVSEGGYSLKKLQIRNIWMVDNCDTLLALWNGAPGGTMNCVRYAERKGNKFVNVWNEWTEFLSVP